MVESGCERITMGWQTQMSKPAWSRAAMATVSRSVPTPTADHRARLGASDIKSQATRRHGVFFSDVLAVVYMMCFALVTC
jgi:hypothetical protein